MPFVRGAGYRPLNDKEKQIAKRAKPGLKREIEVLYETRGNFTLAFARPASESQNYQTFVGLSKRNPLDNERPESGRLLALRRALSHLPLNL